MSGTEKNKINLEDLEDFDGEEPIVVMTDEEGNEYFYHEEIIIPIGEKRYAVLAPLGDDDACGCGCGCDGAECSEDEMDEMDVFIARIDIDELGEEVYVDPTDEEFEQVRQVYEQLLSEDDEEDEEEN